MFHSQHLEIILQLVESNTICILLCTDIWACTNQVGGGLIQGFTLKNEPKGAQLPESKVIYEHITSKEKTAVH